ncbi:hypothetical protein L1F30_05740 [Simiduia sp. 21SJ11W-1]|uniref:hypothetical protein n=1 Tax=Simiduia sp. 21SJ11W-1 TaxID=2909669 RepID=UPI00209E6433|nr:hypothetical protein [Simiduia sp. 21SJ11W-1]UTA49049.1 hypothetical protein L1F30_05740 [Simiduia sp. 21SJ11W-1]
MNTLRSIAIAAATLIASSTALAETSIQAPVPSINTEWALAAIEEAPQKAQTVEATRPALVTKNTNSWTFRDVVNGQLIEIEVTELAANLAQEIAKRAAQSAFDLAGI